MSHVSAEAQADAPLPTSAETGRFTQLLLLLLMALSFGVFWYAGRWLGVPAESRHGGSLLDQPSTGYTIRALIAAIVLLGVVMLLAHAVLSSRWWLGGLAVATAGWMAWSARGGPAHEVYYYASSVRVFPALALESLLLCGFVGALWMFVWSRDPARAVPLTKKPSQQTDLISALVAQCVAMAAMMLILAQTDSKKQALASVLLSGLIGTSIAESQFPLASAGRWYWIGPLVVSLLGYVAAFFSNGAWDTGSRELSGMLAALARALPVDYASAGMLGCLVGYWWMTPVTDNAPAPQSELS